MKVKIKKLSPEAVIPTVSQGNAGIDLTAVEISYDEHGNMVLDTKLAIEIPEGYFGMLAHRSSISKYSLSLVNKIGIIDSCYRGSIMLKMRPSIIQFTQGMNLDENAVVNSPKLYEVGDRVGQLIILPYPQIELEEVEELSSTERGEGGFGSTGN